MGRHVSQYRLDGLWRWAWLTDTGWILPPLSLGFLPQHIHIGVLQLVWPGVSERRSEQKAHCILSQGFGVTLLLWLMELSASGPHASQWKQKPDQARTELSYTTWWKCSVRISPSHTSRSVIPVNVWKVKNRSQSKHPRTHRGGKTQHLGAPCRKRDREYF